MPTLKAALVGHGISGSLTPEMHEAEAKSLGVAYKYHRFDTATEPWSKMELAEIVEDAKDKGFAGLNITHPFKVRVVDLVDQLSEAARVLGAINTIVITNGVMTGHNTDYTGFASALAEHSFTRKNASVLLLGAGGAAPAVALALLDHGVQQLTVFDLDPGKSQDLAERIMKVRPNASVSSGASITQANTSRLDGIVNATPMGMKEHPGEAIDPSLIPATAWVSDIVYFPLETSLLATAKAKGCQVMTGAAMAVHQAAASLTLFTGLPANATRMRQSFDQIQNNRIGKRQGHEPA